jgi:thiol-disulfide isomerase/thioredoxin
MVLNKLLRSGSLLVIGLLLVLLLAGRSKLVAEELDPQPAPEFTQSDTSSWINSAPLKLSDLQGHVVLAHVWTYGCWNCYRSFPWLNALEGNYASKGLTLIGIHTPEFDQEKNIENIRAKTKKFGLNHPVMVDNDFRYWNALGNRYWPSYYLIDKKGIIRARFIGEIHPGDSQAREIEAEIGKLLVENASASMIDSDHGHL